MGAARSGSRRERKQAGCSRCLASTTPACGRMQARDPALRTQPFARPAANIPWWPRQRGRALPGLPAPCRTVRDGTQHQRVLRGARLAPLQVACGGDHALDRTHSLRSGRRQCAVKCLHRHASCTPWGQARHQSSTPCLLRLCRRQPSCALQLPPPPPFPHVVVVVLAGQLLAAQLERRDHLAREWLGVLVPLRRVVGRRGGICGPSSQPAQLCLSQGWQAGLTPAEQGHPRAASQRGWGTYFYPRSSPPRAPAPPVAVQADLCNECVVGHHHGARPEQRLEVVWQLAAAWASGAKGGRGCARHAGPTVEGFTDVVPGRTGAFR